MSGAPDRPRQLSLDLPHRPAYGRDDFLVNACNAEAVDWVDRWPDWPVPALAVHGPTACGKTHLIHVWRARSGAQLVAGAALGMSGVSAILEGEAAVALEDADRVSDEEALLHVYNWVVEERGTLMLSGRSAPARWPLKLPDLASRLATLPVAEIQTPDDELLGGILVKQFHQRQLRVGEDVVRYMLRRMERSFAAVHRLAQQLDDLSLAEGRAVTIALARSVLELDSENN